MEESTKDLLKKQIDSCIEHLNNVTKGSDEHKLLCADIAQLVKAYTELENMDFQKSDTDRKFKEEIRKNDLDRDYRDMIEREKMQSQLDLEREKLEAMKIIEKCKLKESHDSGIRDALIKGGIATVSTAACVGLTLAGLKFEMIDNGSITSFLNKELFRKVFALPPKVI